jgi:hypothetical protein
MCALQCVCTYPGCTFPAVTRRQATAYQDDASNHATLCVDHHVENDAYWQERWADYYSDITCPDYTF